MRKQLPGWKSVIYNTSFAINCLLVFLLVFESRLAIPAWVQVIGRMHPLLVHFPIVLFLLTVFWILFIQNKFTDTSNIEISDGLLLFTSLTAALSALMGLLLSNESGYASDTLAWHKWGGILLSLFALAWFIWRQQIRKTKLGSYSVGVLALAIIIITGHLGADITHGENFVSGPVLTEPIAKPVLFEEAALYSDMVAPILQAKCAGCHNETKAKGQLIMINPELLMKGGKSGLLWDSTDKANSLLLTRIHLPLNAKKHMPPAGKPQLTEDEEYILNAWIMHGANFKTKVAELPATDSLRVIAASMFSTIETDNYSFAGADESKIKALHNNYRAITPLALGSPALNVEFFGASQFKPEQLKELSTIKDQVVSLNLNKIPVTDNDLGSIAQFTNLRRLNLAFTNIAGKNLAALKGLKELKELTLSGTGVTANDLTALAGLKNLTHLYLWSTPAQTADLTSIKKQLKNTDIETGYYGDTVKIKLNQPEIDNEQQVVLDTMSLLLKHFVKNVAIHFTTDGAEPDSIKSPVYNGSFIVDKNMTVKAKAFKQGWVSSDVVEKTFFKAGYKIDSIHLLKLPEAKYKAFGTAILFDNKKGGFNSGNGKWLGFQEPPMELLIYLNEPKEISSVTLSMLIDVNASIMPPTQINVYGGDAPTQLKLLKSTLPVQPDSVVNAYMKGYELSFKPTKASYIKVVAIPIAKLPKWHKGKGKKGWLFVDEVFVN